MHPGTSAGPRLAARLSLVALVAVSPAHLLAQPAAPAAAAQPAPATTPTADLPSAQSVIDHFIQATGGRAAYEKITNRVTTGKFEVPAQGVSGDLRLIQAAPNKMRGIIDLPGLGKLDLGTNGDIAWQSAGAVGAEILTGPQREKAMRDAFFNPELHLDDLYIKMETVGLETINEHPCYKVVLTPKSGSPETRFYDKESGLLVKSQTKEQTPEGEVTKEEVLSDWKDVDGVKQPHLTVIKGRRTERRIVIAKIEQNTSLPADAFEPPAEVKKLLDPQPKPQIPAPPEPPTTPKTPVTPRPNTPESPK